MSGFADVREICRNCHCPTELNEATRSYGDHRTHKEHRCLELLNNEIERLRAALSKINDIRNSIIAHQKVNFSEHVYPLVAALNEAGFQGMPYPEARAFYGPATERAIKAEAEIERLRAENAELRADAERYRWLRRQEWIQVMATNDILPFSCKLSIEGMRENMDAAIDAARSAQPKPDASEPG